MSTRYQVCKCLWQCFRRSLVFISTARSLALRSLGLWVGKIGRKIVGDISAVRSCGIIHKFKWEVASMSWCMNLFCWFRRIRYPKWLLLQIWELGNQLAGKSADSPGCFCWLQIFRSTQTSVGQFFRQKQRPLVYRVITNCLSDHHQQKDRRTASCCFVLFDKI